MKENWTVRIICVDNNLNPKVTEEQCENLLAVSRLLNVFKPKKGYKVDRIDIVSDWWLV